MVRGCDQQYAHEPSCGGGNCNQTGATEPSCDGGGCTGNCDMMKCGNLFVQFLIKNKTYNQLYNVSWNIVLFYTRRALFNARIN